MLSTAAVSRSKFIAPTDIVGVKRNENVISGFRIRNHCVVILMLIENVFIVIFLEEKFFPIFLV